MRYKSTLFLIALFSLIVATINFVADRIKKQTSEYSKLRIQDIDKIYFINLERSQHRFYSILKQLDELKLGIPYERFNAIDGYNIKITELNHKGKHLKNFTGLELYHGVHNINPQMDYLIHCSDKIHFIYHPTTEYYYLRFPLTAGQFGAACSHIAVWHDIVEHNYQNVIILEDDARFVNGFKSRFFELLNHMPKKWDMILLHSSIRNPRFTIAEPMNTKYLKLEYHIELIWSFAGYILTQNTAKQLIETTRTITTEIDSFVFDRMLQRDDFHIFTPNYRIHKTDFFGILTVGGFPSDILDMVHRK